MVNLNFIYIYIFLNYQAVKYKTNTLDARLIVCLASFETITPSGSFKKNKKKKTFFM
jgi:hypothetical protein